MVRILFKNSQISGCAGRLCTCWEAAGKDTARGLKKYGGDSGRSCQIDQCVPSGKDAGWPGLPGRSDSLPPVERKPIRGTFTGGCALAMSGLTKRPRALLTVSPDTVYDLFKKGELPGRKVGRKWLTTRSAVLRWIENSAEEDTLTRAIEQGDAKALAAALKNRQVEAKKRQ